MDSVGPGGLQPPEALQVTGISLEPAVTSTGEPFRLEIDVPLAAGPVLLLHPGEPLGLQRNGVELDSLDMYDDGTHGDVFAGDHRYTLDALILPTAARGIASSNLGFVRSLHEPGAAHPEEERWLWVKAAFRSVDPARFPVPAFRQLAPDLWATDHVVVVRTAEPLDGTAETLSAITQRYYEFFPDDRDFLVVEGPTEIGTTWSGQAWIRGTPDAGLGNPYYYSYSFGSAGYLKSAIQLSIGGFTTGGAPTRSFCLITHEILHRWAAYTGAPLASSGHWTTNALARTDSGFGSTDGCVLNDFELYLAGLVPMDSVADPLGAAGYQRRDFLVSAGPRIPAWPDAQRDFTIAFIAVLQDEPDATAMAFFDAVAGAYASGSELLGANWRYATGQRSTMTGRIVPIH